MAGPDHLTTPRIKYKNLTKKERKRLRRARRNNNVSPQLIRNLNDPKPGGSLFKDFYGERGQFKKRRGEGKHPFKGAFSGGAGGVGSGKQHTLGDLLNGRAGHKKPKGLGGVNEVVNGKNKLGNKKGGKNKKGGGKSGGKGGGKNSGMLSPQAMAYYGMGKFKGPDRKKAALIVQREVNKTLRELRSEARQTQNAGKKAINKTRGERRAIKGDLRYLFNEADDYIGAQNEQINSRYNQTAEDLGSIFGSLQANQGQQIDARRAAAMAEMERLGIQQTGMGQFDADAAYLQGMGQQQQANALANLDVQKRNSSTVGDLLQSMSRGSRTSLLGQADMESQENINDIRGDVRGQLMDIFDSMREVKMDRPRATNELWMQMQDSAYQQWAEQGQMNFQNQLAANQFNLDVSKLNSDNLWKKAAMRQEAKKAAAKRRQQRQMDQARNIGNNISNSVGSWADLW